MGYSKALASGRKQLVRPSLEEKSLKIGILGAGQLALMLGEAAQSMGFHLLIYAQSQKEPACIKGLPFTLGEKNDQKALREFFAGVDVVIFESELWDSEVIKNLAQKTGTKVLPGSEVMAVGADKYLQKKLFQKLALQTAAFVAIHDPSLDLALAKERFPKGFVLKWSRGGYDGRGNLVVKEGTDPAKVDGFLTARPSQAMVYAEEWIAFQKELALVSVRYEDGRMVFFPLVETIQQRGVCSVVKGSREAHQLLEAQNEAQTRARIIGEELKIVGTFALEFFLTPDQKLVLNEMAPRVHNSGHVSMQANQSQFLLHIKAILGEEANEVRYPSPWFGMVNILGPLDFEGPVDAPLMGEMSVSLVWYGKKDSRPDRKLGHINVLAESREELEARLTSIQDRLEQWQQSLTKSPEFLC